MDFETIGGDMVKNQVVKGLGKKDIKIPNSITRSAQGLSLAEKRLVFAAVAKAGRKDIGEEIFITAAEYAETFGMTTNEAYDQLKRAALNLRQRYFTLAPPDRTDSNGVTKKGKGMVWEINWMSKVGYEDGQGKIGLRFGEDIRPYLENLKGKFTLYKLQQAGALRSIHSWRLLEFLEQWESKGETPPIKVKDFCFAMEASKLQQNNFGVLRTQIIEPAVKELKNDGWTLGFTFTKAGRKVDKLVFTFRKDPDGNKEEVQGDLF